MAVSATEVDNILVRLVGDASSYQKMIDNAVSSTKSAATSIQQSSSAIQGVADSIGALAGSVNQMLIAVAGTGQTLTAFMQFDKALTESVAIMKVTDDQINQMRRSALDLAPAAGLGPEALARGFYYLASAGLEAEAAIKSLPAIVNFAVAGNFDLARATTLAADAQAALGLKTKDAQQNLENLTRVTDVLVKGNVLSNTTTEQLSLALTTNAAAAGRAFGKSIEEVTAVLAVYADQGTKAQVAGNAFSRALRLLAYSAIQHKAAFEQLGIAVFNDAGKMRNMADIVDDLDKALGPLNDKSRAAALNFLGFEARIQQAIIPLLGTSAKMREFQKTLEGAGGTAEEVAEKTRSSLNFQIRALSANIKVLAVEIGSFFAPAMALVANIINTSINLWRSLSIEVKNASIAIGTALLTFAGLGPIRALLGGLGGLVTASIAPVIAIFAILGKVIINPFLLLIYWFNPTFVLFRNLISVIAAVVVAMQEVGGAEEFFRMVEEAAIDLWKSLTPVREALSSLATTILAKVIAGFTALGNAVLISMRILLDNVTLTWNDIRDGIVAAIKVVEFVVINLEKIFYGLWIGLKNVFSAIISYTTTTTQTMQVFKGKVQESVVQVDTFTTTFINGLSKLIPYLDSLVRHLIVIGIIVGTVTLAFKILAPLLPFISGLISGMIVVWKILTIAISVSIATIGITIAVIKGLILVLGFVGGILGTLITGVSLFIGELLLLIPTLSLWAVKQFILGVLMGIWLGLQAVWNALMSLTVVHLIAVAAGMVGLGVSIVLVSAAVKLLIGLLAGLAVVLVSVLASALNYVISPVVGLYLGLYQLTKAFQAIPTNVGLLKIIGDIFGEWLGIIKLVIEAVQVDMDLAWKIFQTGVMLGLEQIKDMWPEIWNVIKIVFSTAGTLIKNVIGDVFEYIDQRIQLTKEYWAFTIVEIGGAIKSVFGQAFDFVKARLGLLSKTKESQEDLDEYAKKLAQINRGFDLNIKIHTGNAARDLRQAFENVTYVDTPKMKQLRNQIEELKKQLAIEKEEKEWQALYNAIDALEDPVVKAQKEAKKLSDEGERIDQNFGKAKHTVDNLTASIVGSAEAATRMSKYLDLFFLGDSGLANLNQEGVKSTIPIYGGDAEWAKARAEMEELEKLAEMIGYSFVNDIQNADWDTILFGFEDKVNEIANNILYFTKPEAYTPIQNQVSNLLSEIGSGFMSAITPAITTPGGIDQSLYISITVTKALQNLFDNIDKESEKEKSDREAIKEAAFYDQVVEEVKREIAARMSEEGVRDPALQWNSTERLIEILNQIAQNTEKMAEEKNLADFFDTLSTLE